MAKKITQKELKHDEFVEAAFDLGHWFEKNLALVAKWIGACVVVVVATIGWWSWSRQSQARAQELLASSVGAFMKAETEGFPDHAALQGTLEQLQQAARKGGRSEQGRVARFYEAAALIELGRGDEATAQLETLAATLGPTDTLGASAQELLARVQAAAGRTDEAVATLEALLEAENAAAPEDFTVLQIGLIQAEAGLDEAARQSFQRIVDEFPQSPAAAEARRHLES